MAIHIQRREFIVTLGSAVVWPFAARAQQAGMPVVGFLNSSWPGGYAPMVAAFRQGLNEPVTLRVETSQLNIAGRSYTTTDYRSWRPI